MTFSKKISLEEVKEIKQIAFPVNIIIINANNQILLLKRKEKEDQYSGFWSIPGGGPEPGENYEQALFREIEEEIGCKVISLKYFNSYYFKVNKELHVRALYFYGQIEGEIEINQEFSEFKWFNLDEISSISNIAFNQKDILEDFIKFFSAK